MTDSKPAARRSADTDESRPGAARPGRPRSERAEKAILDATIDLLAEESGVDGVSMEAVAARAGVAKTTIYRRWPNKEALIVGALGELKGPLPELPGTTVRDDLLTLARHMSVERGFKASRCFWNVVGGAEKYPGLYERYRQHVLNPRRAVYRAVLRRGMERGELRGDLDVDVAVAMLVGAFAYHKPPDPLPDGFAEKLVDTFLRGVATD
ncbi:TetR/AcrR family transcriptional regulator [Actinomadura logoneensis]|uniref:TetR/AcrR family transcriptional regulator n=1 Tax=Actinomadura logoneensis TaxID=2293572 RepID=A0A372J9Y1_9ACTN|nr:TetR/AcrR family transcriptional regulator [Actinomadura logoneensis]RFU36821.1 TetR/AcrR family transcriptional regulator [Actinomadura logoneensis]